MISQLKSIAHDSMCESACKIFRLDSTERPFPSFSSFEFDATIRIASSLAGLRVVFFAVELESRAVGIAPVSSHAFPAALVSVALSLAFGVDNTSSAASWSVGHFEEEEDVHLPSLSDMSKHENELLVSSLSRHLYNVVSKFGSNLLFSSDASSRSTRSVVSKKTGGGKVLLLLLLSSSSHRSVTTPRQRSFREEEDKMLYNKYSCAPPMYTTQNGPCSRPGTQKANLLFFGARASLSLSRSSVVRLFSRQSRL